MEHELALNRFLMFIGFCVQSVPMEIPLEERTREASLGPGGLSPLGIQGKCRGIVFQVYFINNEDAHKEMKHRIRLYKNESY